YNILKQNQGDVNDAMQSKKRAVVITSDPLALVAEQTKVSKRKENVIISSESEGSDDELKKISALLAKAFNPTNNLRTSSATSSANKKQESVKYDDKKEEKKVDKKKRDIRKVKCYNCKKEGHFAKECKKAKVKDYEYYKTKMWLAKKDIDEQVLLAEDHAWMESSSDSDQEINANMVFMAQMEKVLSDFEKSSSSSDDTIAKQTNSLKPYVPTVILEKIIIDLEDEVVRLLEKEKANLAIIESLKPKGSEPSENEVSKSEDRSKNDCQVVEKECDDLENSNVIAPGMFKLNTRSAHACNADMNVACNSYDVDVNDLFVFNDIVQICLWIIDSGCSKLMTGNRALLTNFVEKFLGTVHFGNNDFAMIAGYGDVVIGSMPIKKVYCVEGLGYNLFSIGQFCDKGLEVAFRKSTCFVRNENGVDLLTGDC
nr:integrase, catalytic region, zinc finger, CCHC-type, peptidase aspartic, catalytic [Tanacetum cinerariifolium]